MLIIATTFSSQQHITSLRQFISQKCYPSMCQIFVRASPQSVLSLPSVCPQFALSLLLTYRSVRLPLHLNRSALLI